MEQFDVIATNPSELPAPPKESNIFLLAERIANTNSGLGIPTGNSIDRSMFGYEKARPICVRD